MTIPPLTAEADQDIEEIAGYLGQLPAAPATRIGKSLRDMLRDIARHPYRGAAHSELTRLLGEEVRSRLVAPYRIYYRLGRSGPEIISILHGSRNQRNILSSRFRQ